MVYCASDCFSSELTALTALNSSVSTRTATTAKRVSLVFIVARSLLVELRQRPFGNLGLETDVVNRQTK